MKMETVSLATVQEAMFQLLNHYPESGHNGDTFPGLVKDYHEDLSDCGVSPCEFAEAIKQARWTCRFFPKVSELLGFIESERENHRAMIERKNSLALPEYTTDGEQTPEERKKYQERIRAIRDMIAGKLSMDETLEKVSPVKEFS